MLEYILLFWVHLNTRNMLELILLFWVQINTRNMLDAGVYPIISGSDKYQEYAGCWNISYYFGLR